MREFIGWVSWAWSQQETWQKWWIFAMFCMGLGLAAGPDTQIWIMIIPGLIFGYYLTKWCVWDAFHRSWAKYKQHRNDLLTVIKTSHKDTQ